MIMAGKCPIRSKEHMELQTLFGIIPARTLWERNGEKDPTPVQAIHMMHPGKVSTEDNLKAWDQGTYAGKKESRYEKEIEEMYIADPDQRIGGGESFNQMTHRSLSAFRDILNNAPANSLIVASSSVIKALDVWEANNRPKDLRISPEEYRDAHTHTGELEEYEGKNGTIYVARHGQTYDNVAGVMRRDDAQLTDEGKMEAEKAAKVLAQTSIPHVYTSTLPRTIHTTHIILSEQGKVDRTQQIRKNAIQRQLLQQLTNPKDIKYELQSIISGTIQGGPESKSIQSALDIIRRSEGTSEENGKQKDKLGEIWKTIQQEGLGYTKNIGGTFLGEGQEHQSYRTQDKKKVIKVNKTVDSYDDMINHLEQLLLHNYFLPETAYKLLGFKNINGKIHPIVEQQYIEDIDKNAEYDMDAVKAVMGVMGFEQDKGDPFDYHNKDIDISIQDLHQGNVVFRNGIPIIIDPMMTRGPRFYKSTEPERTQPIPQVTKKVRAFISSLGGSIQNVTDIVVDGRKVPANAIADVISRTIQVADGKEKEDTLPEEAAHIYVHWLPAGHRLLTDMMRDIVGRKEYKQVYEQYKKDPQYQNSDGTPNVDKLKKEAIGKVIASAMVQQVKDKQAQSWLQRILSWIKSLFKGKDYDSYQESASDILGGKVHNLDMKALKEANGRGELYYQMPEEERKFISSQVNAQSLPELQRSTIEKLQNPDNHVVLDNASHTYTDLNGNEYQSTTQRINGEFAGDTDQYEINRLWGNDMDSILQGVILGTQLADIQTITLSDKAREDAYKTMDAFVTQMTEDGSVAMTQVVVATPYDGDPTKRVAGSIDLLLVHPDGEVSVIDLKTSWHSIHSTQYGDAHQVGKGSVLINERKEGMSLSRSSRYATQVGSYSKMLELIGYSVKDQYIKNIYIEHENIDGQNTMTGYTDEGVKRISESVNRTLVDKVVPGEWTGKQAVPDENPLHDIPAPTDEDIQTEQQVLDKIKETVEQVYQQSVDWRQSIQRVRKNSTFKGIDQSVENIDNLIASMEHAIDTHGYKEVYTVFLNKTKEQLENILKYVSKRQGDQLVNASNPEFLHMLSLAAKYIRTYDGLQFLAGVGSESQMRTYAKVNNLLKDVGTAIKSAATYVADKNIYDLSVNVAVRSLINKSSWNGYEYKSGYGEAIDIPSLDEMAASLGGTTIADVIQKRLTRAQETAREEAEKWVHEIEHAANKLAVGGKVDYSFMMETDKEGKFTGKIIDGVGQKYREMQTKLYSATLDDEGNKKQYKPVNDPATADPKDIEYNKELYIAKQAYREFMSPEDISWDEDNKEWKAEEGTYHKYTPEFLAERSRRMRLYKGKWVFIPVSRLTQEAKDRLKAQYPNMKLEEAWNLDCKTWRERNYSYSPYTTILRDKDGKLTGMTKKVEGDAAWFPKEEHTEIKSTLADDKYHQLMDMKRTDQYEFYQLYRHIMDELIPHLPHQAKIWHKNSNAPVLPATLMQQLSGDENNMTLILNSLKANWTPKVSLGGDKISHSRIPVAMMNRLYDVNEVTAAQKKVDEFPSKRGTMSDVEYEKQLNKLKNELHTAQNRLKASELSTDLGAGLVMWTRMATNYKAMSNMEQEVLNLVEKVKDMQWEQQNTRFGEVKNSKVVDATNSRTLKMINWWMDAEFYNDANFNKTAAEFYTQKLLKATSVSAIMFNMTGMINNAFVAARNNSIESIGGDFFGRKEYRSAVNEYSSTFWQGRMKTMGENKEKGHKKVGSKYEAMVHQFNMVNHSQKEHKVSWISKTFGVLGYGGYEAGEYMVQSQVGIAILKTVKVKNTKGEEISLYDAYKWNPDTGTVELEKGTTAMDGSPISDDMRHDITHRIWKTNERIHGNYRWKVQLEKYMVGRIALQFHKWVYPNYKIRFGRAEFHEALGGGMDIEGRYVTLVKFMKSINELKSRADAWDKLTDHQRNNLKKDLADAIYVCALLAAYFILRRIADGIPDDDPYTRKMVHWFTKEADRSGTEMGLFIPVYGMVEGYKLIKNPFASVSLIQKFNNVLIDVSHMPFQDHEDMYYQRGAFKGDLKLGKHMRDLVPFLRQINEWENIDVQTNFFIR